MLSIRYFFQSLLGGTDLMWDVALGVFIGGLALGAVCLAVYVALVIAIAESR